MATKLVKKGISAVDGKETQELVIFNPSNASAISEAMGKLVKRSKQYAKDARTDLFRFTELSLPVLAEMQNSKQVVSVQTVKAVLWSASGQSIPKSGSPEYKYASEITLESVRSAILVHDKKGFKMMSGQLHVLEKVDKPMVKDTDQFGTKIDGTSVPNPSTDYKPVQRSSISKYFGALYPDSVEVRGTKKQGDALRNQAMPDTLKQFNDLLTGRTADGTPAPLSSYSMEGLTLLLFLASHGVTLYDRVNITRAIENVKNGEPTAVAVNA
jgi:uncharacterized protein YfiM (DUF2279 family)